MPPAPRHHEVLHAALRAVIDRRDPEGLLALGAPTDEYDPEAAELGRIHAGGDALSPATVAAVWERWFGPHSGFLARVSGAELDAFAAELEAAATRAAAP